MLASGWRNRNWRDLADNSLISLALLGPLALVLLYRWYFTLDTWYVPWGQGRADYFDQRFDRALQQLQEEGFLQDGVVHVITDSECVCSKPVIKRLMSSDPGSAAVVVHDMRALDPRRDAHWVALARRFPSVPSALVMRDGKAVYIGPVVSGNLCSPSAESILPVMALNQGTPVVNWLSEGCFCAVPKSV